VSDLSTQAVLDSRAIETSLTRWVLTRDNRFVAGAGKDAQGAPKVLVFDAVTGAMLATLAGTSPIAIATTPSGAVRVAALVPDTFDVRVWSVPDGAALFDITGASDVWDSPTAVAFSPDGSLIASGVRNIRIFQVDSGTLRETLPAHTDPESTSQQNGVFSLAFSATGQIASMGFDATTRLWCSP
jgi:WD40 repeat protein